MSSYLLSLIAQSSTTFDWNWLLIFFAFVIVLAIALIVQTRFSAAEADQIAAESHHEEQTHSETAEDEFSTATQIVAEPELEHEVSVESDDLKKIEGIGPKVAELLEANDIVTFAQLADTPVERLAEMLESAQLQMMKPASWPQQASLAAAGEWEALQKLQDELQGGR